MLDQKIMEQDSALQSFGFKSSLTEGLQKDLQNAMIHFYCGEWTEFDTLLSDLTENEKTRSRAYFFSSLKQFWSLYFLPKSAISVDEFVATCESAIALTKTDSDVSEIEAVTVESSLQGYMALICVRNLRLLDAAKYGLAAYSTSKKLLSYNLQHPALLLSNGIYNYMFDNIPAIMRSMILGSKESFSKEKGLMYLLDLARSESLLSVDSALILCELKELSPKSADKIITPLLKRFPKNAILISVYQKTTHKKWSFSPSEFDQQFHGLLSENR